MKPTTANKIIVFVIIVVGVLIAAPMCRRQKPETPSPQVTIRDVMAAIACVESNHDDFAKGQAGEIGRYQLTKQYVKDVRRIMMRHLPTEDDRYNPAKCQEMMITYWSYYASEHRLGREITIEDLVRIHNGGPNGWRDANTIDYWHKVEKVLAVNHFKKGEQDGK